MKARTRDVVIIGGGIAGGALATLLARSGLDVLLLERQTQYRDRVRGEYMAPWGVAEAKIHGLLEVLLGVEGAAVVTHNVPYDEVHEEEEARSRTVDFTKVQTGAPGGLDLGHPEACAKLADAAAVSGADVVFGVSETDGSLDARSTVRYVVDGREIEQACRLVVGADGRASATRAQFGLPLRRQPCRTYGAGLLVEGITGWPEHTVAIGTEGNLTFFVFPRHGARMRLYLFNDARDGRRFTGADGAVRFLDAFRFACLPGSDEIREASPIGPCAAYPMNDTWVDDPSWATDTPFSWAMPRGTAIRSSGRDCRSRFVMHARWRMRLARRERGRGQRSRATGWGAPNGFAVCDSSHC